MIHVWSSAEYETSGDQIKFTFKGSELWLQKPVSKREAINLTADRVFDFPLTFRRPSGGPSLPMPLILYDGSEEELMDTIEREFNWLIWKLATILKREI